MRTSPQPSVIIPHLTTSVALLLSALMQRRFRSCQCDLHAHPRLSAHVTQRINVTNHLQGTAPHHRHSAAAYLLVRACFSVPACESFSRSWSSTVFFSSLLGRHVNRDWKRAAEVRQGWGRAGHGRHGQAYWSSPQQKKKKRNYH